MLKHKKPLYCTANGKAFVGDSLELMKKIDSSSIDLVLTSPPFALQRKKNLETLKRRNIPNGFSHLAKKFFES